MTYQFTAGGHTVTVDESTRVLVTQYRWGVEANARQVLGMVNGKQLSLHRFLMNEPKGLEVDHINGDPLDNRLCNLRICTHAENMRNRKMHKNNKCGAKGVYMDHRKRLNPYRAEIKVDGRKITLGAFATVDAAAQAYRVASKQYHGEFARL
ncbi:HNH endonuclease [Massilia antarctica]|uniref:HNH endonuclease n=1 Tax=Massilia antarctica TaxID=2765360 RepID=UPI0022705E9E|nr:HNH endonuclease [Massilia sp. H27-R4]MCY0913237.1 HNH endonuclease [Massilia sp. H27-R4]